MASRATDLNTRNSINFMSIFILFVNLCSLASATFSGKTLQAFLNCTEVFSWDRYQYGISTDNALIITPESRSMINVSGIDVAFEACILIYGINASLVFTGDAPVVFTLKDGLHDLNLNAQSHIESFEINDTPTPIDFDVDQELSFRGLEKSDQYYFGLPSDEDSNCENTDLKVCSESTYYSLPSAYKSMQGGSAVNDHGQFALLTWPHHDCAGVSSLQVADPGEVTACICHTVYSWQGAYSTNPCYQYIFWDQQCPNTGFENL